MNPISRKRNLILYAVTAGGQFGRLLTMLAIAMTLLEISGSAAISWGIVVQSIPAVLLPTVFASLVPKEKAYQMTLVALSANAALLIWLYFNISVFSIFLYFILSGALGAYIRPTVQFLISRWIEHDQVAVVRTRIGSINAFTGALAPVIGGALAVAFGLEVLLLLDALIYLAVIFGYLKLNNYEIESQDGEPEETDKEESGDGKVSLIDPQIAYATLPWIGLLIVGAILNAVEFEVFRLASMDEQTTGLALGAFGAGGFLAFLMADRALVNDRSSLLFGCLLGVALTVMCIFTYWPLIVAAMFVSGLFNALLVGRLQTGVQFAIPKSVDEKRVWAQLHRAMAILNISLAGLAGLLLGSDALAWVAVALLPASTILFLAILGFSGRRAPVIN